MKKYIIYYRRFPEQSIGMSEAGLQVVANSEFEACIKSLEKLEEIICRNKDPDISRGYTYVIHSIYLVDNSSLRKL
jgi:hypothetical protein